MTKEDCRKCFHCIDTEYQLRCSAARKTLENGTSIFIDCSVVLGSQMCRFDNKKNHSLYYKLLGGKNG